MLDNGIVSVSTDRKDKQSRASWGATRSHINNMVIGVTDGWKKSLELSGVGYTADVKGKEIVLKVGYSHDVRFPIPPEVTCKVERTSVHLESNDKQVVGNLAAQIRASQKAEPYLGKGVRYVGEYIRRKAGKAGK